MIGAGFLYILVESLVIITLQLRINTANEFENDTDNDDEPGTGYEKIDSSSGNIYKSDYIIQFCRKIREYCH